jgi:transposase-like protein
VEGEGCENVFDYCVAACGDEGTSRLFLSYMSHSCSLSSQDFYAAAALLEPLCVGPSATPALRSAIARIYLQGGHISAAARHFSIVEQDASADAGTKAMNTILLASANGDWSVAEELAASILEQESDNVTVSRTECFPGTLCRV